MRDALDAAWGDFPVGDLDWLRYTGSARPDAGWVNSCLAAGLIVTFIQESYPSRSSEGFDVGVADCRFAEARAREVHPGVRSIAVVVSDGNGADNWDASEYGRGWQSVATLPFFAYGAVPICESFARGAPASLGTWVPETWGQGTLMSQVVGPSPVADTDLNHVHADYTGGAAVPARKGRSVIYREDKADGTHDYCLPGAADMVSVPEAVGAGHAINGDIVVPIKTVERIAMGVALKKSFQAASGAAPAADLSSVKSAAAALQAELAKL